MAYQLTLKDIGEDADKLLICGWFLKEGDTVDQGQDLLDVETDKAALTVPSPVSGTIKQLMVKEGDEVGLDVVLCEIETV